MPRSNGRRMVAREEVKALRETIAKWKETARSEKEALRKAEIEYRRTKKHIEHLQRQLAREKLIAAGKA